MQDILIIFKISVSDNTVQTLYYFTEENHDKGYEVLKLLNTNSKDGVYYTTTLAKEYTDEEYII